MMTILLNWRRSFIHARIKAFVCSDVSIILILSQVRVTIRNYWIPGSQNRASPHLLSYSIPQRRLFCFPIGWNLEWSGQEFISWLMWVRNWKILWWKKIKLNFIFMLCPSFETFTLMPLEKITFLVQSSLGRHGYRQGIHVGSTQSYRKFYKTSIFILCLICNYVEKNSLITIIPYLALLEKFATNYQSNRSLKTYW